MGEIKDGDHVDARFEFNHYDLDISHYRGNLAAYALGRLLRRLQWHHEQAVVLAAEGCWDRHIPPPEWRGVEAAEPKEKTSDLIGLTRDPREHRETPISSVDSSETADDEIEVAGSLEEQVNDFGQELDRHRQDEACLRRILTRIRRAEKHQWVQSDRVANQVPGVIRQLPQADEMEVATARLKEGLEQYRGSKDFVFEAKKCTNSIHNFESESNFETLRIDRLKEFVRVHSTVYLTRFGSSLKSSLRDELKPYLQLGEHLEECLCPKRIFEQMLPDLNVRHKKLAELVRAAGLVLGFRTYRPGSVAPTDEARIAIMHDLQSLSLWDDSKDLFGPKSNADLFARLHYMLVRRINDASNWIRAATDPLCERATETSLDTSDVYPLATASISHSQTGYLAGKTLANALGISDSRIEAFLRKLERMRSELGGCWIEVANPKPNSPRYLYCADSPKLRELASKYLTPNSD